MSLLLVVAWLSTLLEVGVLVGLLIRRRIGQAYMLPLLLVSFITPTVTVAACPACNTWDFWIAKEFVHLILVSLLGLEMAQRVFATGAARRAAQRWVLFVVVLLLPVATSAGREPLIVETLPALIAAVGWLYTGLAVVILRYGVRIERLHDVILSGFAPYFMIYAATWSQAATSTRVADLVNPFVQLVLLVALLRAAWQRPRPKDEAWFLRVLARRRTPPAGAGHASETRLAETLA